MRPFWSIDPHSVIKENGDLRKVASCSMLKQFEMWGCEIMNVFKVQRQQDGRGWANLRVV